MHSNQKIPNETAWSVLLNIPEERIPLPQTSQPAYNMSSRTRSRRLNLIGPQGQAFQRSGIRQGLVDLFPTRSDSKGFIAPRSRSRL